MCLCLCLCLCLCPGPVRARVAASHSDAWMAWMFLEDEFNAQAAFSGDGVARKESVFLRDSFLSCMIQTGALLIAVLLCYYDSNRSTVDSCDAAWFKQELLLIAVLLPPCRNSSDPLCVLSCQKCTAHSIIHNSVDKNNNNKSQRVIISA